MRPWTLEAVLANGERTPDGCLLWKGYTNGLGYGRLRVEGRYWVVHRYVWSRLVGPIPEGMTIDHVCHNVAVAAGECEVPEAQCPHRRCFEISHLRVATQRENWLAGRQGGAALWRAKTHCKWGHPFDEENTGYLKNGERRCRTCARERAARRRARLPRRVRKPLPPTCRRGHLRSEHEARTQAGHRYCRACNREKTRERRARLAAS